ncbi:MAG: glycosyltransferase family 1 protein [Anaerolineales bacterium]|nr:glycosyltransferase family 1 protein [Anaerolineales bacterium]
MHIVLPTIGSAGDVIPVIGLGLGLKARGHRVTMLTNPYFRAMIERVGLELAPVGTVEDFQRGLDHPDLWHPVKGFQTIMREAVLPSTRIMYQYLSTLKPDETIIAASGMSFGARLAQEKLGFRLVTVHLQPTLFMSAYDNSELGGFKMPDWLPIGFQTWRMAQLEKMVVDPIMAPTLNAYRTELGLPPVSRLFGRWMHSPHKVLCLFPDWFAPTQPDWPPNLTHAGFVDYQPEDAPLTPEIETFLAQGDAPLVFTPGSAMQQGERFFRAAIEATQQLGKRAILLTRFREHLPAKLPAGFLHVEWVQLGRLLPFATGLVNHGGIGTMAQALKAGIPQLIVPFAHDQPDNANRLKALGIADRLDPGKFTTGRAVEKLQGLTDPVVRARCAGYAEKVDFEASLKVACQVIDEAE